MRILLVETLWQARWQSSRLVKESTAVDAQVKAEDVKAHGLSESEYLAVVPAEFGVGGIVNGNGRIYPPARFATENAGLNAKAKADFVGAESGHPEGPPTLNVAARIIEIEVTTADGEVLELEQGADGSWALKESASAPAVVKARGKIAFLRNQAGESLWVLYRAGMKLGTSSRSFGVPVPHKLDDDSPYSESNPDHAGSTVDVIEQQELITYDVVADPSAGTYIESVSAREAYGKLRTSIPELPPQESRAMEVTLEFLKKNHPDLLKQIEEAAAAAALGKVPEHLRKLDEGRLDKLLQLAELTEGKKTPADDLEERIKAVVETQTGDLRAQLMSETDARKRAEEERKTEAAERQKLKERLDAAEADLADRKKLEAAENALTKALAGVHSKIRPQVEAFVRESVGAGLLIEPDKIEAEVKRTAEAFKAAAKLAEPSAGDDDGAGSGDDGAESDPDPVAESLMGEGWRAKFAETIKNR